MIEPMKPFLIAASLILLIVGLIVDYRMAYSDGYKKGAIDATDGRWWPVKGGIAVIRDNIFVEVSPG